MSPGAQAGWTRLESIDAALPQTQCTRCGFPDCRAYAEAIDTGLAGIDRCPPGGAEGVARLAALTGQPGGPLAPAHGTEGPRRLAVIVEAACIGCTRCIEACPVDCIVGAARQMHTVIESLCTGCELCLPACPVDCILLEDATPGLSGWAAWSPVQAAQAQRQEGAAVGLLLLQAVAVGLLLLQEVAVGLAGLAREAAAQQLLQQRGSPHQLLLQPCSLPLSLWQQLAGALRQFRYGRNFSMTWARWGRSVIAPRSLPCRMMVHRHWPARRSGAGIGGKRTCNALSARRSDPA